MCLFTEATCFGKKPHSFQGKSVVGGEEPDIVWSKSQK